MTRIDFYVLRRDSAEARLDFACRLTAKAWRQNHHVYLHSPDRQAAEQLDELLWRFRPEAFIPHRLIDARTPPAPVTIGWEGGPDNIDGEDVMINLAHEVPPFFEHFHRVSEIVIDQHNVLQITRQHWLTYKERGYTAGTDLMKHDIPG